MVEEKREKEIEGGKKEKKIYLLQSSPEIFNIFGVWFNTIILSVFFENFNINILRATK